MIDPRDFGRLEGKVDAIIARLDRAEKLEKRVGKLEAWRNYMAGAIAVLIAAFSIAVRGH